MRRSRGACEVCRRCPVSEIHHRQPRGMGGAHGVRDALVNRIENALGLCMACHRRVESRRVWAMGRGYLVSRQDAPEEVPVWLQTVQGFREVWLGADGGYWFAAPPHDMRFSLAPQA